MVYEAQGVEQGRLPSRRYVDRATGGSHVERDARRSLIDDLAPTSVSGGSSRRRDVATDAPARQSARLSAGNVAT